MQVFRPGVALHWKEDFRTLRREVVNSAVTSDDYKPSDLRWTDQSISNRSKMKFGSIYEEYLRAEQDKYLTKCSHVEYKRLKKVLKRCRVGRSLQADGTNSDQQQEGSDDSSDICECNSCTLCDQMFFTELTKEASEIAGCFSSRVQRLLHLHVPSGLLRYIWRVRQCFIDDQQIMVQEGRMLLNYVTMNAIAIRKILKKYDKIHGSVSGRDFKSKMQTEHIELLQSPWLIELGAFHLNCDSSDIDEPVGFFKNGFLKNFSCELTGAQPLMTMAISETMKYEYSLTCPICLDTLFNPYALSCGHLFCKGCACGAASVYIFQGVRSAPPEAKCPVCRAVGVFAHAVQMTELDLLIKTRSKYYWRQRLREERTEMVKQAKEYWESQAMLSMGI